MKQVEIYTDGACSGNPGRGGWGGVIKYKTVEKEMCGGERQTTNNRMELTAVIKTLECLKEGCEVSIYTDSKYIVDSINKDWVYKWKQNNWMRTKSEPALNTDLWEELLSLMNTHKCIFIWVKGHNGNPYNERCDKLATDFIKRNVWVEK